jgi:hypothetical protein
MFHKLLFRRYAPPARSSAEDADLDLRHVEPGSSLGSVMELDAAPDSFGLFSSKRFGERLLKVGIFAALWYRGRSMMPLISFAKAGFFLCSVTVTSRCPPLGSPVTKLFLVPFRSYS